jgi:competence ComEA-like helix-hairpin-helix protein
MPRAPEHRAVLLLLGLAVGGQAIRAWVARPGAPPGEVRILPESDAGILAHRDSSAHADRPLAPGERIDLDRASVQEIARLPRIGLSLAKVIVADRQARGPFGSLEQLDRVAGVGPGLLGAVGEHVSFSGRPSGSVVGNATDPGLARGKSGLPGSPRSDFPPGRLPASAPLMDLNTATVGDLERLPLIGPSLAARIVALRDRHGPFVSVDDLEKVPGIGPATVARLRDRVVIGR